jgi:hypothetical protein
VVERGPEKAGVGGSIPSLATTFRIKNLEDITKASDFLEASCIFAGIILFSVICLAGTIVAYWSCLIAVALVPLVSSILCEVLDMSSAV